MQPDRERLLELAKRVFPQPEKTREEVETLLERPVLESIEAAPVSREERLRDGTRALEKLSRGEEDLTPAEAIGLEAIVLTVGRPALLVQDDDFAEPPEAWAHLADKREMLKKILPSVGRVELTGHHSFLWCGTAFLVGDGLLMTNKHVAQIFAQQEGAEWRFMSGVTAHIDYAEEFQRATPRDFAIDRVLAVHPSYDLALLSVNMDGAPPPLTLEPEQPNALTSREVAVIGYPALDSRNGRTEQAEIFQDIYDVKRLLPGKATGLRGNPVVLGHDCSTLGGNSGSCVIDLESGNVIGLHFGGQFLVGNFAVPIWQLKDDVHMRRFALNWEKPAARRRAVRS